MRWKRWIGVTLAALVLLGLLAVVFMNDIVLFMMTPRDRFDPGKTPAAPDYSDPSRWSALPERDDAADAIVPGLLAVNQASAPADVFYVHPTSHVGPQWNASLDDNDLNAATDRVATRIQASAFNGCCAVYAPRYRQTNGTAYTHPSPDGKRAIDVAYTDVRDAFRSFLARRGQGRPFILASHSQGSMLAFRLLREEISQKPLRAQLIAAWIVGGIITEKAVLAQTPDIPPCTSPEEVGCILGWNAQSPTHIPSVFQIRSVTEDGRVDDAPGKLLCVNPVTGRHDEIAVPRSESRGAVFLDADPTLVAPAFASAACRGGKLVVDDIGVAPRDFMSSLLDRALGEGNYHPIEYQIFFLDIRHSAEVRTEAWLRNRGQR
jgi:hypothetical protein